MAKSFLSLYWLIKSNTWSKKEEKKTYDSWNQIRTLDKLSLTFIRNTNKKKTSLKKKDAKTPFRKHDQKDKQKKGQVLKGLFLRFYTVYIIIIYHLIWKPVLYVFLCQQASHQSAAWASANCIISCNMMWGCFYCRGCYMASAAQCSCPKFERRVRRTASSSSSSRSSRAFGLHFYTMVEIAKFWPKIKLSFFTL